MKKLKSLELVEKLTHNTGRTVFSIAEVKDLLEIARLETLDYTSNTYEYSLDNLINKFRSKFADGAFENTPIEEYQDNSEIITTESLSDEDSKINYHLQRIKEIKFMAELNQLIFEALGEASMCWSETPKGIFDGNKAKIIGDDLISKIMELIDINNDNTTELLHDIISWEKDLSEYNSLESIIKNKYVVLKR